MCVSSSTPSISTFLESLNIFYIDQIISSSESKTFMDTYSLLGLFTSTEYSNPIFETVWFGLVNEFAFVMFSKSQLTILILSKI